MCDFSTGWLTTTEARTKLGVSRQRIDQLCKTGLLPGVVRIPHSWLIPERAVEDRLALGRQLDTGGDPLRGTPLRDGPRRWRCDHPQSGVNLQECRTPSLLAGTRRPQVRCRTCAILKARYWYAMHKQSGRERRPHQSDWYAVLPCDVETQRLRAMLGDDPPEADGS